MAFLTFATRFGGAALLARGLPRIADRWLAYFPVAILTALGFSGLVNVGESTADFAGIGAALAGIAIARTTGSMPLVIVAGLISYWLLLGAGN